MAVETADYLAGLDPAAPGRAAPKIEGDDHIRLLKKTARQSFPGFTGAILLGGIDEGVANAYVLKPATPLVAYTAGMIAVWLPANTNGGASTVNVSGLGLQAIRRIDGAVVANGDIMAGQPVAMMYTGTQFRLLSVSPQQISQLVFSATLPNQTGNGGKFMGTDGLVAGWTNAFGVAVDEARSVDINVTATLDLRATNVTGNYVRVLGSGTVTAITLPAGAERVLSFAAAVTLTHSGALIVPGSLNFTTVSGDVVRVRGEGEGIVRVVGITRRDGRAVVEPTPPGMFLLAEITPTAVAAIDVLNVFSSAYDSYRIVLEGVNPINGTNLRMRFARSGVVDDTTNYSSVQANDNSAGGQDFLQIANGAYSGSLSATIDVLNANAAEAAAHHHVLINSVHSLTSNAFQMVRAGVHRNDNGAGALSGFRFYNATAGNFGAVGKIRVYGYRKA